jgi:hypothetical protein
MPLSLLQHSICVGAFLKNMPEGFRGVLYWNLDYRSHNLVRVTARANKAAECNGEGRTKEVSSEEEGVTFDVDPAIQ